MLKTSQVAAKVIVRLFFLLLIIALVPYFYGGNTKLQHLNLVVSSKWALFFPGVLVCSFLFFLVVCTIHKYKEIEQNWLLVVSTVVLMAYGIALFIHIYQMVK